MRPSVKMASKSESDGGRVELSPRGVEPVAAIATTATSTRTTSAGRTTDVALPRIALAGYATPGSSIGRVVPTEDLLSQYRLSAPWTLMNQTNAPMIGNRSHRPVHPLNGGIRPSFLYIFPTSDG